MNNQLTDYLKAYVGFIKTTPQANKFKYCCIEDLVLQHGKDYIPQKLPRGYRRGEMKQCFMNSFQMMLDHSKLIYVEGYAWDIRLPIACHHAWCVDEDGKVYEPTWSRDVAEGTIYLGIPFKQKYVIATCLRNEMYGIIDNYKMHFPLLSGTEKIENVIHQTKAVGL